MISSFLVSVLFINPYFTLKFSWLVIALRDWGESALTAVTCGQANLIVSYARLHPFYPTASNYFIIAIINHVYMFFYAMKAGYHFTAQQTSVAALK